MTIAEIALFARLASLDSLLQPMDRASSVLLIAVFVIRWKSPSVWAVGKVLNWSQSTENNNAKNALTCVRNVQMANAQNAETVQTLTLKRMHVGELVGHPVKNVVL